MFSGRDDIGMTGSSAKFLQQSLVESRGGHAVGDVHTIKRVCFPGQLARCISIHAQLSARSRLCHSTCSQSYISSDVELPLSGRVLDRRTGALLGIGVWNNIEQAGPRKV